MEPRRRLATVTFLVPDYDAGLAFFCGALGWVLLEDLDQGHKRWVRVAPAPEAGPALLLAEPTTEAQRAAVGQQGGDRVAFFLETDAFDRDYAAMRAAGVRFLEAPRDEPYGRVAQWEDPWGNRWDLLQPAR